jgi:uncharacterized protein (TIGR02391 family)
MEATDADCRFDPKADIRPGDVVTITQSGSGHKADRVVDTVNPSIDGQYLRVTWRPLGGAPYALALSDLHPAVQKAASLLYVNGHYAEAISAATKALEIAVRDRSGLPWSGNLMGNAFGDGGTLSVRRHRGLTGEDEQTGFRFLFMGAATALRNPRTHEFIEDDSVSALEHLALASMLMRRLDQAKRRRKTSG